MIIAAKILTAVAAIPLAIIIIFVLWLLYAAFFTDDNPWR